jgi:hypothetical protein
MSQQQKPRLLCKTLRSVPAFVSRHNSFLPLADNAPARSMFGLGFHETLVLSVFGWSSAYFGLVSRSAISLFIKFSPAA